MRTHAYDVGGFPVFCGNPSNGITEFLRWRLSTTTKLEHGHNMYDYKSVALGAQCSEAYLEGFRQLDRNTNVVYTSVGGRSLLFDPNVLHSSFRFDCYCDKASEP